MCANGAAQGRHPLDAKVNGHYVYEAEPIANWASMNEDGTPKNKPKDMKVSAGHAYDDHHVLVLERAKGQVKIFLVAICPEYNLYGNPYVQDDVDNEMDIEDNAWFGGSGYPKLAKKLIYDSSTAEGGTGPLGTKVEGVVPISDTEILIIQDNDSGTELQAVSTLAKVSLGLSLKDAAASLPCMPGPKACPPGCEPAHVEWYHDRRLLFGTMRSGQPVQCPSGCRRAY